MNELLQRKRMIMENSFKKLLGSMLKRGHIIILFILLFLFFSWLTWNTPLTGDDWTWQSQRGIDRLKNHFENYNGRYLSNVLEIIFVRIEWVRIIAQGIFSAALVYFAVKSTSKKITVATSLLAMILLLTMPIQVYAQTFGWTAGYVNYVISIVGLLVYLSVVSNIFKKEEPKYKKIAVFAVALLGFCTQLLVEHMTIFAVYTAILVVIWSKVKYKKFFAVHISYLVSTLVGAVIMFSNGAYLNVFLGKDTYREISDATLMEKIITIYSGNMHRYIFENNTWIVLFVSIVGILIFEKYQTKSISMKVLKKIVVCYFYIYSMIVLLARVPAVQETYIEFEGFYSILSVIYFIFLGLIPIVIVDRATKIYCWYLLSGVLLLSAPFIFIAPYGPRCAFASIVFLLLFGMKLLDYLSLEYSWSFSKMAKPLIALSVVVVIYLGVNLYPNGEADRERLELIAQNPNGQKGVIQVQAIPNPKFHWMPDPHEKRYMTKFFKENNNIPPTTKIKLFIKKPL